MQPANCRSGRCDLPSTLPGRLMRRMDLAGKAQLSKQCQEQLALAIAIVNSKPASISVIDHIQQIRSQIQQSQNHSSSPTPSSGDKYFDSVAFWKQAYTKAEDVQSKLNDRIYELEQRVETLKLKLKQEDGTCNTPERGKRKGSKEPSVPDSQRKRQKTNNVTSSTVLNSGIELDGLNELINQQNSSETRTGPVMRYLSVLQQHIQKKPNWSSIYLSAVDLCKSAASIITLLSGNASVEAGQSNKPDNGTRTPNPIVILAVIETAHTLLCRSLNKVMSSIEGKKYEGQIIYHMVSFFETTLCALGKTCSIQAAGRESTKSKRSLRSPSSRSPGQVLLSDPSKALNGEVSMDKVSDALSRVLAGMMLKATTLITVGNNSLFEGYLYVFLNRVGAVLSVVEFKDILTNPDLQASSEKLLLPEGLRRAGVDGNVEISAVTAAACEIETYHLVWLLEKAIALVHSISIKSSLFEDTTVNDSSNAGQLLRFTKKRLQSTLLKAVFHEDEPLFLDSLEKPQHLPTDDRKIPINKESASEWFSREVWRLLGWDILESIWKCGKGNLQSE